ncbi:MAG: winged helix-turn-helix transcriptional regulator [Calditrichaeota bacterium]|nr:winged helix-turn-helix transcriptional regulator [Calditrichota bacterium]
MRDVLKLFKALSDGQRLRILKMLEVRPLCVCEITEVLQLATSTVSKHLSILRDADLIRDEKDGKWVNYSLNTSQSGEYSTQILPLVSRWLPAEDLILQDAEKVRSVDRNVICGA